MRIIDWSSDVCSSDLGDAAPAGPGGDPVRLPAPQPRRLHHQALPVARPAAAAPRPRLPAVGDLWRLPGLGPGAAPAGAIPGQRPLPVRRGEARKGGVKGKRVTARVGLIGGGITKKKKKSYRT